jgi:hypothetical protein
MADILPDRLTTYQSERKSVVIRRPSVILTKRGERRVGTFGRLKEINGFHSSKNKYIFFWVITPYNLVFTNDSEEHSASFVFISSLMMEAVYSCETSITPDYTC